MEEQVGARLVNGKVTEFIEDEQRGFRVFLKFLFETTKSSPGSR